MKYSIIKRTTDLFYKLAQENSKALQENDDETELKTVTPHPEFNKLANTIDARDLIATVPNDGNYSRDIPVGDPIHIAMVDSVVVPSLLFATQQDYLGAKPALLVRVANFANEVEYQRKPSGPKQKIIFKGAGDYIAYALELVSLAGGNSSLFDFNYIEPNSDIKPIRYPNENFGQWVIVTFKK